MVGAVSSWPNEVMLEFLQLYKREPILWNQRHPDRNNKTDTAEAWQRIVNAISIICTVNDLKKKKEHAMNSFRLLVKKKIASGGTYVPRWFAYELMESFLGEQYNITGENLSHITGQISQEANDSDDDKDEQDHEYTPAKKFLKPRVIKKECPTPREPVRLKIRESNYTETEIQEADESDLFCQLLVKKFKRLDDHQRDIAMHEIDNIMYRIRMQGGSSHHYSRNRKRNKSPMFIVAQSGDTQYEETVTYESQGDPIEDQDDL